VIPNVKTSTYPMPDVLAVEIGQTLQDLLCEELDNLLFKPAQVRRPVNRRNRPTRYIFQETANQYQSNYQIVPIPLTWRRIQDSSRIL
jgi:hypothetical protein